jgi:hypothetical protein
MQTLLVFYSWETEDGAVPWIAFIYLVQNDGPRFCPDSAQDKKVCHSASQYANDSEEVVILFDFEAPRNPSDEHL